MKKFLFILLSTSFLFGCSTAPSKDEGVMMEKTAEPVMEEKAADAMMEETAEPVMEVK